MYVFRGSKEECRGWRDNQDETWENDIAPKIASEMNNKFNLKLL